MLDDFEVVYDIDDYGSVCLPRDEPLEFEVIDDEVSDKLDLPAEVLEKASGLPPKHEEKLGSPRASGMTMVKSPTATPASTSVLNCDQCGKQTPGRPGLAKNTYFCSEDVCVCSLFCSVFGF